jgi:phage baseplate assembly protein W
VKDMGAILIDLNTGDPYLDENCNTVEVVNNKSFEQVLDGLFHCDPGSEPMNPRYGFDLKSALRDSYLEDADLFIESLVAEALDDTQEKLISKVELIQAERDENDPSKMNVTIVVTSVLQDTVVLTETIGE